MKNHFFLFLVMLITISSIAQQTQFNSDPQSTFKEAKEYFQKEQYSLAYPLFKELQQTVRETDKVNIPITTQEIGYYTIVCALKQNEGRAEEQAQQYVDVEKNAARVQMMSFHLAEFLFRQQRYSEAAALYEEANIGNLSNREIADMKFHQGYAYFTQQRFAQAKPLFNGIRTIKDDPNYIDANYYYGFLAFRDGQYNEALQSFTILYSADLLHPGKKG
jgi:tetratricopeptide (TPR) repeat protein